MTCEHGRPDSQRAPQETWFVRMVTTYPGNTLEVATVIANFAGWDADKESMSAFTITVDEDLNRKVAAGVFHPETISQDPANYKRTQKPDITVVEVSPGTYRVSLTERLGVQILESQEFLDRLRHELEVEEAGKNIPF